MRIAARSAARVAACLGGRAVAELATLSVVLWETSLRVERGGIASERRRDDSGGEHASRLDEVRAAAGAQGGARQADTPDQPESSRKKQKLERGQASGSGGDSPAAAGARSSASKRKEKMKQKGIGNVAAAASAERAGQAVKDAGVAGQARGREGGGKTGANELKAKERAEEREEKT